MQVSSKFPQKSLVNNIET